MDLAINKVPGREMPRAWESATVFVTDVTGGSTFSMLEKTLAFTESRNRMLAENIANILTPGYRTKQVSVSAFQKSLQEASAKLAKEGGSELKLESTKEVGVDEAGLMKVTPTVEPAENLLFQDGTNARIERQMAMLAENTMMNQATSNLLQQKFKTISEAIRGRVS